MNSLAILSGHPPFPNPQEFRRAKTYGFWCELCSAAYILFVPQGFSFEQAEACQKIGRGVCTEEHPSHSERFEIPIVQGKDSY